MNIRTLFDQKKIVFSFEVFPPKRTYSIDTIYKTLEELKDLKPDYISVTYGAGGSGSDNRTLELAKTIREKYGVEPLAHITCINSTKQKVEEELKLFKQSGITNVLALRGDITPDAVRTNDFQHASDLVSFIKSVGDFNIVGACYPEGHPESENMVADIRNLKRKVDMGVTHLNSQLFFDNDDFYRFIELAQTAGIDVPIQAGIMPVTNSKQIERMVSMVGAKLPSRFAKIMARYGNNPVAMRDAGIAYATEQIIDLAANDVKGIHLYTMNNSYVAKKISDNISSILSSANE